MKDACAAKPDKAGKRPPRLVADVGANFGYYSLYAASMGCRRVSEQHQLCGVLQHHLWTCLCVIVGFAEVPSYTCSAVADKR